jgi:hypothetical protein
MMVPPKRQYLPGYTVITLEIKRKKDHGYQKTCSDFEGSKVFTDIRFGNGAYFKIDLEEGG